MSKKMKVGVFVAIIFLVATITLSIYRHDAKDAYWTHQSFRGTVLDVWREQDGTIVSVKLSGTENVKNFIINEETTSVIVLETGKSILIESDYDMHKHNGRDIPYPVIMIVDPSVSDKE